MADSEQYDPVAEAEEIARIASEVAQNRDYPVQFRVNTAVALEEYLLTSRGLYHFPDENESFWSDPKYLPVLIVTRKLRAGLNIDSHFGHPLKSEDSLAITTVAFQEEDMDIVNGFIVGDLDQVREYPPEWWLQNDSRIHSDEAHETAVQEWREGDLLYMSGRLRMLKEINTAFIAAGAPPRSGFTRFFDVPPPTTTQ